MDQVQAQAQACGMEEATSAIFDNPKLYTEAVQMVRKKLAAGQVEAIAPSLFEQVVQRNSNKIASQSTPDHVNQLLTNIRQALPKLEQQSLQQAVLLQNQCCKEAQANTTSKANISLLKQAMCSMQPTDQLTDIPLHMGNSHHTNHTLAQSGLARGNQYKRCVNL